jgi:hypothetical protein
MLLLLHESLLAPSRQDELSYSVTRYLLPAARHPLPVARYALPELVRIGANGTDDALLVASGKNPRWAISESFVFGALRKAWQSTPTK